MSEYAMKPWTDYFPNGRHVFYEGDDPHSFVREMKTKFNFDPSKNNKMWNEEFGWCFFLPGHCINEVYDRTKYPLGS